MSDALLQRVYELATIVPPSMNVPPAHFVFLRTPEAKARLLPALRPGDVEQTTDAPVTVIVACAVRSHDETRNIGRVARRGKSASNVALATAPRQATYFIVAARALGLDCEPMGGFDAARVDAEFFPDGGHQAEFLCNLGRGDRARPSERARGLRFDEAAQLL